MTFIPKPLKRASSLFPQSLGMIGYGVLEDCHPLLDPTMSASASYSNGGWGTFIVGITVKSIMLF